MVWQTVSERPEKARTHFCVKVCFGRTPAWPKPDEWAVLNKQVEGDLIPVTSARPGEE